MASQAAQAAHHYQQQSVEAQRVACLIHEHATQQQASFAQASEELRQQAQAALADARREAVELAGRVTEQVRGEALAYVLQINMRSDSSNKLKHKLTMIGKPFRVLMIKPFMRLLCVINKLIFFNKRYKG